MVRSSDRRSGKSGRSSGKRRGGMRRSTFTDQIHSFFYGVDEEIPLTDMHNRTKEDLMGLMKDEDGEYNPEGMENVADDLLVAIDENNHLNAQITELNSANEELVVTNTSLLNTITKNAKVSKRMVIAGFVLLLIAVGITFGVTYTSTTNTMEKGTTEVKNAVKESDKTNVEVDGHGQVLLTDSKTGQEISTRSTGDGVRVTTKTSPISGQRVMCMVISDAATLYNDAITRTFTSVEIIDENGEGSRILPLNGDFQDVGNVLHFGPKDDAGVGIKVILDSDACSTAVEVPLNDPDQVDSEVGKNGQDVDPVLDTEGQDVEEEEDVEVDEVLSNLTSPFKRRLRHPLKVTTLKSHKANRPARKHPDEILAYHRHVFTKAKAAVREGRLLEEDTSVVVEVDDSGSFVGGLACTDPYVDNSNLAENLLDLAFSPLEGSSLDTLETTGGQSLSIVTFMKDELADAIADLSPAVLLPQKICSNAEEDLATRGGNANVEACETLDMLGNTDVFAFGYHDPNLGDDGKGICAAFNDGTQTYAFAQSGILPPIKIQAVEITVDALAVSITKQLTAETLNEMWDGTDNADGSAFVEQLTVPGHFVMKGTGEYGIDISNAVKLAFECSMTMLVDMDRLNDGVGPSNGAVDFALLMSGSLAPTFEVNVGDDGDDPMEFDLSDVFSVDADFFMYVEGSNTMVQLAVSRNYDLAALCDVALPLAVFCEIFTEASFEMAVRSYANNDGFGVQFSMDATMEFKNGFDIIEDLINWPQDNQVSLALDVALLNNKIRACIAFEGTRFCTGKCEGDADCETTQACDNTFKVCREKRGNGGKCGRAAGCESNFCIAGYCRECPTAGSSTACPSGEYCQRTDASVFPVETHVCRPKKNNGNGCLGPDACESGYCVTDYCRECPTANSYTGCPSGKFCQRTDATVFPVETHVCRSPKDNGSACTDGIACESGNCISGYCRECPTAGSSTACPSGEFCQRTDGLQTHVCNPRKSNGSTCEFANACSSRNCVAGFCRECPTAGSSTDCSSGEFCQRTYGTQTHVCRPRKSNGSTCEFKNACSSNACVSGFCRECPTAGSTSGCPSGETCKRTYGTQTHVCRPIEKDDGGTCTSSSGCKNYCVSGFCRQCPTAGSTTGCSSGYFCQRSYGTQTHVCRPKKSNGSSCSGNGACTSNICTGGYCRACTTSSHCKSGYSCYDNISTGWMKKCCKKVCSGSGIFKVCSLKYCY